MSGTLPKTVKSWTVYGKEGFDSLKFFPEEPVSELGDNEVFVKFHAASLNYRDLIIPLNQYPFDSVETYHPGSDAAGTVLAIGKKVTRFQPGDKVVTLYNQEHLGGRLDSNSMNSGLGGSLPGLSSSLPGPGVFRTGGAINEQGLVRMPEGLSFREAATLTVAALTAWNALFGLDGRRVESGQWVLAQGTGGVSLFAVQLAKLVGCRVVATTSSEDKAAKLRELGADHIINYKETPQWGAMAKKLTTGGQGFHSIIQVAGPNEMRQCLDCLRPDCVINIIGHVAGKVNKNEPSYLELLGHVGIARGLLAGSRSQMEDMCLAYEANPDKLRPVIDKNIFKLEQLREAYEYLLSGKHTGKVVVDID